VRRVLTLAAGVFFLALMVPAWAHSQSNEAGEAMPAAVQTQIECSGFLSSGLVPNDLYIDGGADNDFLDTYHGFADGDYVFLHIHKGSGPTVGQEFRLVRPESETFGHNFVSTGLGGLPDYGYADWYPKQGSQIGKLGLPYSDAGRVKVIKLTSEGVVAQIEFACGAVNIGDIAIPYEARPVPNYTPTDDPDRFALSNGKKIGSIVAVKNNVESAGLGQIVYLNLGQSDNVQPGTKLRVVHVLRLPSDGLLVPPTLPDETVGEVVVLWTEDKSSVAIVVRALRDIDAGDAIQIE
jgi:hypothetical protein